MTKHQRKMRRHALRRHTRGPQPYLGRQTRFVSWRRLRKVRVTGECGRIENVRFVEARCS